MHEVILNLKMFLKVMDSLDNVEQQLAQMEEQVISTGSQVRKRMKSWYDVQGRFKFS